MNQPDLLYTEDTFTVPVGDNAYQAKDSLELRQYPDPPLDKYFNAIVVTAPSPSNFFVRLYRLSQTNRKLNLISFSLFNRFVRFGLL